MTLMVDVQYAFDSVERALRVAEAIAEYDVFFLETPLWVDDLDGLRRARAALAGARSPQGEWLTTRHEFAALIDARLRARRRSPTSAASADCTEARRVVQHGGRRTTCSSCRTPGRPASRSPSPRTSRW